MATLTAGSSVTVTLDSDDVLVLSGKGNVTFTPTGRSTTTTYVDGTTSIPAFGVYTTAVITAINNIDYSTTNDSNKQTTAKYQLDSSGNVTGLVGPGSTYSSIGNTHVQVALLGDSITSRTTEAASSPPFVSSSGVAPWNWANWVVGAPFVFTDNLAISGDTVAGIFSRVSSIRPSTQLVFVMGGINDILAGTSSATIISTMSAGITSLINAGKTVVISTILANNAATAPQGINLLAVNTWINTLSSLYSGRVFVVDGFSATWNGVTTGSGVAATTGYLNADNTHPTYAGAQAFGLHSSAKLALKNAFSKCFLDINIYDEYMLVTSNFSEFRGSTGTLGTGNTGTLADGWTGFRPGAAGIIAFDNTSAYTQSSDFIGAATRFPISTGAFTQNCTIGSYTAGAGDTGGFQTKTAIGSATGQLTSIYAGGMLFAEVEVEVSAPINIARVDTVLRTYFTSGTSPVDVAAYGTNQVATFAGSSTDTGSADTIGMQACRFMLRTPVMRIPENINGTVALQTFQYFDIVALAAATTSATVKFGRPRLWARSLGRMG